MISTNYILGFGISGGLWWVYFAASYQLSGLNSLYDTTIVLMNSYGVYGGDIVSKIWPQMRTYFALNSQFFSAKLQDWF